MDPDALFNEILQLNDNRLFDFFLVCLTTRHYKREVYLRYLQILNKPVLVVLLSHNIDLPTLIDGYENGIFIPSTVSLRLDSILGFKKAPPISEWSQNSEMRNKLKYPNFHPIHFVLAKDNIDELTTQAAKDDFDFNLQTTISTSNIIGAEKLSLLDFSALWNAIHCFKFLLLNGVAPTPKTLYYAIAGGNFEIIQLLLDQDVPIQNGIEAAVIFDQNDILEWLLREKGQSPSSEIRFGENLYPIHITTRDGNIRGTMLLVEHGSNLNLPLDRQINILTPTDLAIGRNDYEMTEYLVSRGGLVTSPAVSVAFNQGMSNIIDLLYSMNIPLTGDALCNAAEGGNISSIEFLINHGQSPNAINIDGDTPIIVATRNNHLEAAELLFQNGGDIKAVGDFNNTALHYAALRGFYEMAEWLIERGADVNAKNDKGETPLHLAAEKGQKEVAILLLENKASKERVDKFGRNPARTALENNHQELSRILNYYSFDDCVVQ